MDTEMGDELRSVHSLSGGETFLVSLALALGLASMASSKLRIESLFIDEGFGSLDPESLQIAMDALDSLQAQGRKVAVISHVAEMHERIPVQIQVQRQGNGQSGLKIVGGLSSGRAFRRDLAAVADSTLTDLRPSVRLCFASIGRKVRAFFLSAQVHDRKVRIKQEAGALEEQGRRCPQR